MSTLSQQDARKPKSLLNYAPAARLPRQYPKGNATLFRQFMQWRKEATAPPAHHRHASGRKHRARQKEVETK
jgi:hypothetical protein